MKKIIVASLLMLSLLATLMLGSCAEPEVKTTVHFKVVAGEYTLADEDVTVKTTSDNENGPSVLDVIKVVMDSKDTVTIELDDVSLKNYAGYYSTDYKGVTYYWTFTINGEAPKAGKADTNYLKDGDTVEYSFMEMRLDEDGKSVDQPYDNSSSVFEEILANNSADSDSDTQSAE